MDSATNICNFLGGTFTSPVQTTTALFPLLPVICNAVPSPVNSTLLLAASRQGFRDPQMQESASITADDSASDNASEILPVNFNVQTLAAALASGSAGELGKYFGAGSYYNRTFNGVIYISNNWPHSQDGYGTGWPALSPAHGGQSDSNQPPSYATAAESALPYPLCSTSYATLAYDQTLLYTRFKIPLCNDYRSGGPLQSFPNALRITNAQDLIGSGMFPSGLSIVTNLPLYTMGNLNATSQPTTPWVPMLVAGDQTTLLTSFWSDANSPWNTDSQGTLGARGTPLNSTLTVNSAVLTGWMKTPSTLQGLQNATGLLENIAGWTYTMNGSLVVGFYPVYDRGPRKNVGNKVFNPPTRIFNFDTHFSLLSNQPPGAPTFTVWATNFWNTN